MLSMLKTGIRAIPGKPGFSCITYTFTDNSKESGAIDGRIDRAQR